MHPIHYFVHVPKTAGVTVRTWLRNVYERDELIFVYPGKLLEDEHAMCFPQRELQQRAGELPAALRVLFGHFIFDPDLLLHEQCRAISIVRDPRARVLSWQRYVEKNGPSLPDPMLQRIAVALRAGTSLPDACRDEGGVAELDNGIVRMFARVTGPAGEVDAGSLATAKDYVERYFDYVGHIDWFEASMQRIATILGRPYQFVPSKNVSTGGRSEQLRGAAAQIDEEWLRAHTCWDEQLVAWLRDRWPPPDDSPASAPPKA